MYLSNVLFRTARLWPDHASLAHDGGCFTWAQTLERVRRMSTVVADNSAAGDRVAVLAQSSHSYVELSFAVPMAGRTLVPMNARLTAGELTTLLSQSGATLLAFDETHRDVVQSIRAALDCELLYLGDVTSPPEGTKSLETLMGDAEPGDQVEVEQDDVWAIIFTGGTTGLPKGVMLSHRSIALNLQSILHDLAWGDHPRFLQVSPMFHMAGLGTSYAVTAWGGSMAFLPRFSVESVLATLSNERCTAVNLVPTMMAMILARDDLDQYDLSALRHVSYGASSIALPTLRRLVQRLPAVRLTQVYGQTEAGGHLTTLQPEDHRLDEPWSARLKSAGRAAIGARVTIRDECDREVAPGIWGEICARIDSSFSRYLAHAGLTADIQRGGWLRTGDIGYLDDAGYLYVTDRIKDMIVSGGENVSSREVEDIILQHPAVEQVAVVGMRDEIWGERVHAHVVPRADVDLTQTDVIAFCRGRIAGFKTPKGVTIRTSPLPLSAIGKVRKDILRRESENPDASLVPVPYDN